MTISTSTLHHATTQSLPNFLCYRCHHPRRHSLGDSCAAWFGQIWCI